MRWPNQERSLRLPDGQVVTLRRHYDPDGGLWAVLDREGREVARVRKGEPHRPGYWDAWRVASGCHRGVTGGSLQSVVWKVARAAKIVN